MTKISQLADIGAGLAAGDEFIIRDVSDVSTPNKKVTASGFLTLGSALGLFGSNYINAGATGESRVETVASGISGYVVTTISGIPSARTTISGYYENASGVVSGVFYPVVTQVDIGTAPNQVPVNGFLGTMAFQDAAAVNIDLAAITQINNVPLLAGGGLKFPPTQIPSADPNTLDDYEEGTWTPNVTNTGYTYTYSNQTGTYTKVGRKVTLSWRVAVTARSGSAGGGLPVVALPFTPSASFTGSALMSPQPAQLVIHKAATGSTSGIRTFLYSGLANGNPTYFWIAAIDTSGNSFDLGAEFNMGGVFIYEV
jgi:hypothetical protein